MNGTARIIHGDALDLPLDDASVDLVVTSPPYYGLRSYTDDGEHYDGQVGDEDTPAEYVDSLLAATREMVRVLKPSGSIWVNLGDKYAGNNIQRPQTVLNTPQVKKIGKIRTDVQAKSLIGVPWRYAIRCIDELALILRAEVIWHKQNSLPESVTDRVRRSHEVWFHFTLQPKYFSAVDEIREEYEARPQRRFSPRRTDEGRPPERRMIEDYLWEVPTAGTNPLGKLPGSVWPIPTQPLRIPPELDVNHFAAFPMEWPRRIIKGWSPSGVCTVCGEGLRPTVSEVGLDMSRPQARRAHELATAAGLTEEHFAAILAVGVSDVGRGKATQSGTGKNTPEVYALAAEAREVLGGYSREYLSRSPTKLAYACDCLETGATVPAVVLDPFGGTGTTAMVAKALGRDGISVDLSKDYCRVAEWRVNDERELAAAAGLERPAKQIEGQLDMFPSLSGGSTST
jgi:DNA modification methylase